MKLSNSQIYLLAIGLIATAYLVLIINTKTTAYSEPIEPEYELTTQNRRVMPNMEIEELEYIIQEYKNLYAPYGVEPLDKFPISSADRHYIECIVAGESKGEPYEGQLAVAQCIRNGLDARGAGYTPQQLKIDSQYSGWDDNPDSYPNVKKAVEAVFDRGVRITEKNIRWFYAPDILYSKWHEESLEFVMEIGGHRFFCEKGGE